MLFILLLLLLVSLTRSKFIAYTFYQTDDLCQFNWKDSVCTPIGALNATHRPIVAELVIPMRDLCATHTLVYVRTRQCIYCPKDLDDIHCEHPRLRRMAATEREHRQGNSLVVLGMGLFGVLAIGSVFALLVIKRSQAHTNLLELSREPDHLHPPHRLKVPVPMKAIRGHLSPTRPLPSAKLPPIRK